MPPLQGDRMKNLHRFIVSTFFLLLFLSSTALLSSPFAHASHELKKEKVSIAVAGNFLKPLKVLAEKFESKTKYKVAISVGSTGKLYAQITNGAPFELFLSADQKRPTQLISQKLAIKNSLFTYAIGSLVLWSSDQERIDSGGELLSSPDLKHLAIANPNVSPYGEQTIQALKALGVYNQLKNKFVQGQNLGQTFQYISSGNIQQGIIAESQVTLKGEITSGSIWILPKHLYQPIKQDAVLLEKGRYNPAAKAFIDYLKTPEAVKIINSFGYKVGA